MTSRAELPHANGNPTLMRRLNMLQVLRLLRAEGPLSRADLVRRTGLSKPTVTHVIAHLETLQHVEPIGEPAAGPPADRPPRLGRPAQLYRFAADRKVVLGIDIGADKLVVLLADLNGRVLASRRAKTASSAGTTAGTILDSVADLCAQVLADAGRSGSDVHRAVVGTPGVVSDDGVVTLAPQLVSWEGIALRDELADRLHCPVLVAREVSLSLLAEQWQGAARDVSDALFVHLGVGVGAALLVNGTIYGGAHGAVGEIGSMPLGPAHPSLVEAGFGQFEASIGGAAIALSGQVAARTKSGAGLAAAVDGHLENLDARKVFESATSGDRTARKIIDGVVDLLAQGISCLVCVLNPGTVILSGGLAGAGSALVDPLRAGIARCAPFPPRLVISTLGDEATALGAVRRATQSLELDLLDDEGVLDS